MTLKSRPSILDGLQILLAMIAPTPLPSRSEKGETMMTYSPQWLLRHFSYDQRAAWVIRESCLNVWDVESYYLGGGQDFLLGNFFSIF